MARFLSEIGKKLSRIFWGRIVVKTGELRRSRLPDVMAHTRKIEICSMRPESRVKAAFFCEWKRTPVSAAGSLLCRKKPCFLKVFDVKPGETGLIRKDDQGCYHVEWEALGLQKKNNNSI